VAGARAIQAHIPRLVLDYDGAQPKPLDCWHAPGTRLCPCIDE
jgi:hypothetical protein